MIHIIGGVKSRDALLVRSLLTQDLHCTWIKDLLDLRTAMLPTPRSSLLLNLSFRWSVKLRKTSVRLQHGFYEHFELYLLLSLLNYLIDKVWEKRYKKDLPPNPQGIKELGWVLDKFRNTMAGEPLLIHDSSEDEDYTLTCGRIPIFSTRDHLKHLVEARLLHRWYFWNTARIVPSIVCYHGFSYSNCQRR